MNHGNARRPHLSRSSPCPTTVRTHYTRLLLLVNVLQMLSMKATHLNLCVLTFYEYESEFGEGTSSREIEVDSYLKAMKMYCDLESGLAYQRNYAWPELNRSFSSEKSIEQRAQTENKLRKLYRTCASDNTADDDKESAKEEEESYDSEDDDGYSCVSKSPHSFNHTLARFIIFQRDLGPKLQDLVAHYTSAVPYDSMVIIDHEGEDQTTEMNLKHYASRGAHIWRCEGSFDYKPEMWSGIVGHYKEKSDFVFPIDGDEYMAVLRRDGDTQSLHWTYEDLRRELMYLQKVGKMALPFKTLRSIPIPSDCNMEDHPGKALMKGRVHDDSVGVGLAPSPMCQIKYTASDLRHYCYNKCFYRGDECTEVDKGNHGIEKCLWPCSDEYGFSRDPSEVCPIEPSVNATFNLSNLTLLHLQSNEFSDFVFRRHCT